jgi:hypothetical protein
MRIGDLIRFAPEDLKNRDINDSRDVGTILKFDTYSSQVGSSFTKEPIIEVLWSNGTVGWILKSRVCKLNA